MVVPTDGENACIQAFVIYYVYQTPSCSKFAGGLGLGDGCDVEQLETTL
ncbi:hypothetical protein HUG15_00545 [Salicibibacter cibarius]|uniref:Uncharacterized protein n=1 Tax=Salicibibacter cibarius TaxID=2743000 RepID=A0A7T7C9W5_9BACI|nr:hypothetical protein HUG15_00545 [Salicibibacter cibarius]